MSQVRRGRCQEASRKPCSVRTLAAGRQLGRAANWGQQAATHNDALHDHPAARGTGDLRGCANEPMLPRRYSRLATVRCDGHYAALEASDQVAYALLDFFSPVEAT